jgi:hypothetical protein
MDNIWPNDTELCPPWLFLLLPDWSAVNSDISRCMCVCAIIMWSSVRKFAKSRVFCSPLSALCGSKSLTLTLSFCNGASHDCLLMR